MSNSERGAIPVLVLISAVGLIVFLFITGTAGFKDKLFSSLFPKPPSHAQEVSPSVPDEILFKFKPGVSDKAKENIRSSHGIKVEEVIDKIDVERGKVPAEAKDKIIEALNKNPQVEFAEPNFIGKELTTIPNDPGFATQWNLNDKYSAKTGATAAWDITKGDSSTVVAVIDSGVYADHEDLIGKIIPGYNFVDSNTDTSDETGHGTAVTGTVATTTNNLKGVSSLGWNTPVIPLRIVDSLGGFSYWNLSRAILYAAGCDIAGTNCGTARAKVINISLGGGTSGTTVENAINYAISKGLVLTAAAGNDGLPDIYYPASSNNVIAVGAITADNIKANFSSTGPQLDVVAPGQGIYTTVRDGTYNGYSGTSFSSPHVAALAALIFSANPALTNQQVVDLIKDTAFDLGIAGWDDQYGCGRIDAGKALQSVNNLPTTHCTIPVISPTSTPSPTSTSTPTPSPTPTPVSSDTTLPVVSITSPLNGSKLPTKGTVKINTSATDLSGISQIQIYFDNKLLTTCSLVTTCSASQAVNKLSTGSHTIKATSTDNSANKNTNSTSITVYR